MFRPADPPPAPPAPGEEPSLEIGRYLVLSSGHIRYRTAELLDGWAATPRELQPIGVASTWFGWFVSTFAVEGDAAALVPEELAGLQRFAREKGCAWLLFDSDGDEVAGLPVFPW